MTSEPSKPVPPIHQIQRLSNETWTVAVTWQDGRNEMLGAFKTELEAKEWAHIHLQNWLDGAKDRGNG